MAASAEDRSRGGFPAAMKRKGEVSAVDIIEEAVGTTMVLNPTGRIDSQTSLAFEQVVLQVLDSHERLLIDFSRVPYISSAGLRVVLIAAKKLSGAEGRFALCGLNAGIQEVFRIAGFVKILKIFDTRAQALAGMEAG